MPFTNTIGSNTIQAYRSLGGDDTDPLFNDVILLLQPTGDDTQAFDDKSQYNFSTSVNSVRGAIPLLENTSQKWSSDYKVINLNSTSVLDRDRAPRPTVAQIFNFFDRTIKNTYSCSM